MEGEQTPDPSDSALKVLPRYNGNIAEVDWRTSTISGDHLRRYGYVYDKLNRLSAGFYQKNTKPSAREYYEKVSYDLNGNIISLKRSAEAQGTSAFNIDELTYVYENSNRSNRLISVTDSSTDYRGYPDTSGNTISYDNNGNMLSHNDKGLISIDYNFLNLPSYITYKQGLSTRQGIIRNNTSYLYRSDGVKVRKIYRFAPYNPLGTATALSTEQTDYLDGFQYKTGLFKSGGPKGGSGNMVTTLEFYPTAEGYFDFVKNKYIYNYADHLGNVRLSYFHNGSSIEILEENNYYPFGLKHEGYNPTAGNPAYQYKYQGQELQKETGWYSFKWRNYMPDVGRFFNVDPLSEKYAYQSHYNFSENKVTSHRELEGLEAVPADNFNKNQSTLVMLGLGRADGRNGDGVGSGTNTLYSNLPKNLQTDGALASLQNSLGSNIAVAAYTGTDSGLAATHMVETISNYRSVNPDGNVIMIGHSLGGKDILNAASSTTENINLVLTMEPVSVNAGGGTAYSSDPYSASLRGNVQNIISLSADKNMFSGGGGSKTVSGQNSIKATMTGTGHTNIDDSMTPYLKPLIQRTDQGVNPVKWFQNVNWNNFQVQPNVRTGDQQKKGTGSGS